ncbi:Mu transposase C-terminal domain-containing protein [Streptomyces sp. HNM0663]|uniref:Mu transposase C-terminal domain-containing protein n=1 Tax=Streptomyces chengmaiensis TaxID=3040919 RepID=A0ABT6I0E6_9ACTN|nr:Mu transposase C-terminal domain-containing protein [Streptomyces chengmaiensis]MDH2394157.1 Mu transposase C-terminal domain-containing protein [Streptomyces chengmaiensis]
MADGVVVERGVLTAQDEVWDTALRQAEVIRPLAENSTVGLADADEAAAMLRISRRGRFILRRDPRDISRIWVLDPDGTDYVEVPYRTLSRPPISAWENKAAVARLRELGRAEVDENALFAMVTQMRQITDTAAASTRKARRDRQRRTETPPRPVVPPPCPTPSAAQDEEATARPFEVIEQW